MQVQESHTAMSELRSQLAAAQVRVRVRLQLYDTLTLITGGHKGSPGCSPVQVQLSQSLGLGLGCKARVRLRLRHKLRLRRWRRELTSRLTVSFGGAVAQGNVPPVPLGLWLNLPRSPVAVPMMRCMRYNITCPTPCLA